jgi:hypothetical protein
MNTEAQFDMLGAGNAKLSNSSNAILKVAAHAAKDLNEYRNSLVHGYIISYGPKSVPSFMKNPRWHGATDRKKAAGDAFIDEPFQDLVLIAAWNLFGLMREVENIFSHPDAQRSIETMKDDIDRAKSYASEARHLRHLMNHEKY